MEKEANFLEEMAGVGLETIGTSEQSVAYLSMVQPDSAATMDGAIAGHWRNSATGEDYGNVVEVVPVAFKVIWNERNKESPFNTIGRYEPHAIKVDYQQPKNGQGYPKMINPETGNEVQELYVYAVILPSHPEAGVLYFNPTVGSMRTCRNWNTQLKSVLLSNGAQAPIFACTWNMACDIVDNPNKKGGKIAKFVKVQRNGFIDKEVFGTYIKPQLAAIQQSVLQITQGNEAVDE